MIYLNSVLGSLSIASEALPMYFSSLTSSDGILVVE